jgi:hypothetical protein
MYQESEVQGDPKYIPRTVLVDSDIESIQSGAMRGLFHERSFVPSSLSDGVYLKNTEIEEKTLE